MAKKSITSKNTKTVFKKTTGIENRSKIQRFFPWLLVIGSVLGVLSAGILTVDKIHLAQHPNASLACDINPIVACGSVIATPQASAFGFPNPIIGLVGFGIVLTVGMALLAGAQFRRWFWIGLQLGTLFGVCFITWLQFQTIYRIGALCPFCMVVWTVVIPMFVYTAVHNIRAGHLRLPALLQAAGTFVSKYHVEIIVSWYLIIILAILEHFWYYWSTLI
jgi:uncharacterized membrane protein